jgi:hypothetical protein
MTRLFADVARGIEPEGEVVHEQHEVAAIDTCGQAVQWPRGHLKVDFKPARPKASLMCLPGWLPNPLAAIRRLRSLCVGTEYVRTTSSVARRSTSWEGMMPCNEPDHCQLAVGSWK